MSAPSLEEQLAYLEEHLADCRDHVERVRKYGHTQLEASARRKLACAEAVKESLLALQEAR